MKVRAAVRGKRGAARAGVSRSHTEADGGVISAARIANRVGALGKQITQAYKRRQLDVEVMLDRGAGFAADLIRQIDVPVVCHFLREGIRDLDHGGKEVREVNFEAAPDLKGRDVLLVDGVLESGVTQEFLLRRLGERQPRSLRLAVLLDKEPKRRVALEPDYFGFRTASNGIWVGYGLAARNGTGSNHPSLAPEAGKKARSRNGK